MGALIRKRLVRKQHGVHRRLAQALVPLSVLAAVLTANPLRAHAAGPPPGIVVGPGCHGMPGTMGTTGAWHWNAWGDWVGDTSWGSGSCNGQSAWAYTTSSTTANYAQFRWHFANSAGENTCNVFAYIPDGNATGRAKYWFWGDNNTYKGWVGHSIDQNSAVGWYKIASHLNIGNTSTLTVSMDNVDPGRVGWYWRMGAGDMAFQCWAQ